MSTNNISTVAVLGSLSICLPTKTKVSKSNSKVVEEATSAKAHQVAALIYPFRDRIQELHQVKHRLIDHTWTPYTLPWSKGKGGAVLVPHKHLASIITATREAFDKLAELRDAFLRDYDYLVAEEQELKKGAFDPSDYPTKGEMERKFSWSMDFQNIPDAVASSDIRVSVSADAYAVVEQSMQAAAEARVATANAAITQRIAEAVGNVVERLSKEDSRVFTSLLDNVKKLVDTLPALNVTGDAKVDAICAALQKMVDGVHVDDLKYNDAVRGRVIEEAKAILEVNGTAPQATAAPAETAQADEAKANDFDLLF